MIFDSIKTATKTAAAWIEKELAVVLKAAPSVIQVADATLKYVGPVLSEVLRLEFGSGVGDTAAAVIGEAQRDLVVANALIYDIGPNPSASALLAGATTNLSGLLAAGHIKNAASVALAGKAVSSLTALTEAVSTATPQA